MWSNFGREQKAAFGLFIMLGISGLILGIFYFRSNLYVSSYNLQQRANSGLSGLKGKSSEIDLSKQDTDKDGLNDFDELYAYGTSPYLEDTDSDGLTDKEEIQRGKDPNCPEGTKGYSDVISGEKNVVDLENPTTVPPAILNPMDAVKNMSVADLRSLLGQSGIGADILGQISDEELEQLYHETISEAEDSGELDKIIDDFNKENGN
jgi:hypothetical protein